MELLLVNDKPFSITGQYSLTEAGLLISSKEEFILESSARYYCKSILTSASLSNGTGTQEKINPALKLQVLVPFPFTVQTSSLRLCSGDGFKFLERIREWCGQDNIRINLKLSQLNRSVVDGVDCFAAKGLHIKNLTTGGNSCVYGCEMSVVNLHSLKNGFGRLTVSMELTEPAFDGLFVQTFAKPNVSKNKRLLEEAVCSDLTIITVNGREIKCHKGMLAVCSDVFRTMFENKMTESITNVLEMRDMSEPALRAFLDFIYYCNVKEASESCDIALELLVAADKYNISELLSAIAELIGFMQNEWFSVDMCVELLIFIERKRICKNEKLEQLQEKVIRVLRSYIKDSFDILLNCKTFLELCRNSPKTAVQLSRRFRSYILD